MVAIRGHFDGKVFVPDEPVDLPRNQRVTIHVPASMPRRPIGTPAEDLMKFAGTLDAESAAEMRAAIEDECERIDPNEW